jgi:vancomycin permeability regulator SanA
MYLHVAVMLIAFIHVSTIILEFEFEFLVFSTTFSNISAIPWRPVSVVEEAGVPGENRM